MPPGTKKRGGKGKEETKDADHAPPAKVEAAVSKAGPVTPESPRAKDGGAAPWWLCGAPEWIIPLILTLIAAGTRLYRIENPPGVVFDEFHFGRFLNQYFRGEYFFDIHPPLGKLTFVLVGLLTGYDADTCEYKSIHHKYDPNICGYVPLRVAAATFGFLTVPLIYSIVRRLGGTVYAGIFAATMFMLDMLNTIESRLILTDSQLMFYMALCLYVGIRFYERWELHVRVASKIAAGEGEVDTTTGKTRRLHSNDPRLLKGWAKFRWLLLLGVVCCACISVKWTGLATPAMIALELTFGIFFVKAPLAWGELFSIAGVVLSLYSVQWWIHFAMLPLSGDGDAFMRIEFQRSLINNTYYDPNAPRQSFWLNMWQLNAEMLSANARIETPHHWMSKWYTWPTNSRGVLYFSEAAGRGKQRLVYLLANPAVAWIVLAAVLLCIVVGLVYVRYRYDPVMQWRTSTRRWFNTLGYLFAAYCLNLAPYIAVNRAAFVYHYMPALMYGEMLAALLLDRLLGRWFSGTGFPFLMALVILAFWHFSPWVYCTDEPSSDHAKRRWLKGWD